MQYPGILSLGSQGEEVRILQYFIAVLSEFNNFIPTVNIDGIYGAATQNAVRAFQKNNGLAVTGRVDEQTWKSMYDQVRGIVDSLGIDFNLSLSGYEKFPGTLSTGSRGESVKTLQDYLNLIAITYHGITPVPPTGVFGEQTRRTCNY